MGENIYRLDLLADEKDYDKILGLLALEAPYGWEEQSLATGETLFRLHAENPQILRDLLAKAKNMAPDASGNARQLEKTDWLEAWREFFTPVICGDHFVVLPPWLKDQDFGRRHKLLIEPKSAFGTGHHATTALCLTAISQLLGEGKIKAGQTFLDLGCGSGVLAFAASACGLSGMGLDIDPLAISNSLENRALNHAGNVEFFLGGIESAGDRQFDLLMANILARPLIEMAPDMAARIKSGGILILSGILDIQTQKVREAYQGQGLRLLHILEEEEWRALELEKNSASGA